MKTCENCKMNRLCKELDALGYMRDCITLHPKRKTNADKIRQMTDEELARWCNDYNFNCPPVECDENGCEKCWLDWLKQEVENDA